VSLLAEILRRRNGLLFEDVRVEFKHGFSVAGRTPKACRGRWQELREDRSPVSTLFKSGGLVKKGE
jgi:hypothetical protein